MEEKKYYWIKLRTDFFNQETMDFLLSQKNGCEYVVLYQMLCLKTANTDGRLVNQVGEMIVPFNVEKIVRDTKYFDYDTVVVALELYKQIGLIYTEDDGNLKISGLTDMVGSESKWAEKKRLYREKQKMLGQSKDNVLQENRDKILEIRDKRIDNRDIDNNIEQEFEAIWSKYPNKKGKDNAMKDFIKARKDGISYEDIDNGLNNYITYIKANKLETRYILHGSTWFHQHRWNDEFTNKDIGASGIISNSVDYQEILKKGMID